MKISIYNVEFGESLLLQYENENLLIDMGSDSNCVDFDNIWNDIYSESMDKNLSIMCSHFHDDHINGILKYNKNAKNISKVFLPDFLDLESKNGYDFVKLSVLESFFESIVLNEKLKLNLFDLLKFVMDNKTIVYFLHVGSNFHVDRQEYKVLWPDAKKITIINNKTGHLIEHIISGINKSFDQEEYYKIAEFMDEGINTLVNGIAEQISKAYGALRDFDVDKKQDGRVDISDISRMIERLSYVSKLLSKNSERNKEIKKYLLTFRKKQNEMSIVFHNAENKDGANVLLLADIPNNTFNRNIACYLHYEYKIIKVSHHGTYSHFTNRLPKSEFLLISNGKNKHPGYGKISNQYAGFYNAFQKPKYNMICTNQRCETLELGKQCRYGKQCGVKSLKYSI